jgi:4-amino-4-deoxy-L-arabinose transferase-like glycosyltransferase
MVLVTSRFWLDGPLLAFSTLAAALFLHGVRRRSPLIVVLAGIVLGYASWVKVTAFLVVPGVLLLGWVATAKNARSALFRHAILFVAIASFIQVWWPVWQWRVLGSPFPSWAGRPVQQLIEASPYMHFIAVERSPWIYLYLLPFILWTWVPSLVLLAAQWPNPAVRQKGLVLASWTVGILGIHIWLALTGYARLLRYVILVTPATILLFALVASTVWDAHVKRPGARGGANASWVLLLLAAAGLVLEIAQGVQVFFFNHGRDLVGPLIRW